MSNLDRAIILAIEAHADQFDKAGEPYILHPIRVMLRCTTEETRIIAMLHDVVEDTPVRLGYIKYIKFKFGSTIAQAIEAITKRPDETYADFIDRCGLNQLARIVKMADIADNMDNDRLAKLPLNEQKRLIKKYTDARIRLWDAQTS